MAHATAAGPGGAPPIRFGTRGSALARAQTGAVLGQLLAALPGWCATIQIVRTEGDLLQQAPDPDRAQALLGTGIFTRQLEERLGAGEIDVAVHSLKDLPTAPTAGLSVVAIPRRVCPWDLLVMAGGHDALDALPQGARVATSSARRALFLQALRPDLTAIPVRGNVDTRLRKLAAGECDALLLAAAGLIRLGCWSPETPARLTAAGGAFHVVPLRADAGFLPAPGQGALAVQMREDDPRRAAVAAALDDAPTRAATLAERACLAALGGGCRVPIGALATIVDATRLELTAAVAQARPLRCLRHSIAGGIEEAEALGRQLAEALLHGGARAILAAASPAAPSLP